MEKQNYLYLAPSKLRSCSIGPELLLGDLPEEVRGVSRILRAGRELWKGEFLSGEANMSHSIANLEYHQFKYPMFCQPGDLHIHFFGTATLSFAEGVETQPDDTFEISAPPFACPLRNSLQQCDTFTERVRVL